MIVSLLKFESIANAAGVLTFTFTARANRAYTLQRSDDLIVWTNVATHAAQGADHVATFNDAASAARQFYRIEPGAP